MKEKILLTTGRKLCDISDFEKRIMQGFRAYRIHLGKKEEIIIK